MKRYDTSWGKTISYVGPHALLTPTGFKNNLKTPSLLWRYSLKQSDTVRQFVTSLYFLNAGCRGYGQSGFIQPRYETNRFPVLAQLLVNFGQVSFYKM